MTALMVAIGKGNVAMVDALLSAGARIDVITGKTQMTALHYIALVGKDISLLKAIFENGATDLLVLYNMVYAKTTDGLTPLDILEKNTTATPKEKENIRKFIDDLPGVIAAQRQMDGSAKAGTDKGKAGYQLKF
jgi:hypothetical protein